MHGIPPEIGQLHRLQTLSLFNNSIGGKIPVSISGCSNLVTIYLDNNNLVGEIPEELGSLKKLKVVYLGPNSLTGIIPPPLGNLSSLQGLFANENKLQGILPHTLGQSMNLTALVLGGNGFSGTFPPSIFNLTFIETIDVGRNQLQSNLPIGLGFSLPNLKFISIASNRFTGTIPASISNASNLQVLQLPANNLTGRVPSLDQLRKLLRFSIVYNHLGSGKVDDLEFLSTLTNATSLQVVDIGNNNFGGDLPKNLSKKLEILNIERNQLFGSIPTGIDGLLNLQGFYATKNKLSGTIPASLGKLQNLQVLSLEMNNLLGNIPSSLGNLTNLISLDLSENRLQGMIPSSLGNCKKLLHLDLSVNNLTGLIPPQITQISFLSIVLDLSQNYLSGSLPIEVGNFKNLGSLDVTENRLSGEIPSTLGSCTSFEVLLMGGNLFQGSIPSSLISSLKGIQVMNLSRNNLSSNIPSFLVKFKFLELLDLSYNNFQGLVPTEGVFNNASKTSVAGNENLCGGKPDFRLPACKFEQPKRKLNVKLKIIISAIAVLIGATLALAGLHLCKSRKRKEESASCSDGNELLKLSYQTLLKATNGFSSDNLIGTGSFGSVYKGFLEQQGLDIAVKVLNLTRRGASKSFAAECEALRNIRHRNLVRVVTACSGVDYGGNDFKALVYEFMVNGSLDDWLHPTLGLDQVPRTLNLLQRLNIAIDVSYALEYLHHHCETPIVHCDLKPSNILLDEEMTGCVSDFGLAKFLSDATLHCSTNQSSSIGIRGTIGYCPPEYGVGSEVSVSGDIYSFGILLLEMFTGKRPTDDMFKQGLSLHNFVKIALSEEVTQIIDLNLLQMRISNNIPLPECLISIFKIGISCSAESPHESQ